MMNIKITKEHLKEIKEEIRIDKLIDESLLEMEDDRMFEKVERLYEMIQSEIEE